MLQQWNVVNIRMLATILLWNNTKVGMHGLQITVTYEFSDLRIFTLFSCTLNVPPTW